MSTESKDTISDLGNGSIAPRASSTVIPAPSSPSSSSPGPPSLNYSLSAPKRRRNIAIFWTLVVLDSVAMPIILYFALWYHTDLSPNAVFSIVTAALGGVSIIDYQWRLWKLWKKGSECRAEGAKRWHLDFFHWCFTFMWIVLMIELIVGTIPENPPIRLLSMPLSSCLYVFGILLVTLDLMRWNRKPTPVKISSQPAGSVPHAAIYFIVEDIVAVDGCGGTRYRQDLMRRYNASPVFRSMMETLSVFWWIGALHCAVITTALVFKLSKDAAFVVGWTVPFGWAGIWVVITIGYVRRMLRIERETWTGGDAEKVIGDRAADSVRMSTMTGASADV